MAIDRTDCEQCVATTKAGHRCKNNTCKWSPTCYVHRDVNIKDSTIENGGLGVFARKDLKKDTVVGKYKVGTTKMTLEQLNNKYPRNQDRTHVWSNKNRDFYDAMPTKSIAGRFNTCRAQDKRRINCNNNAKILSSGNIKLTKNVRDNHEIFVSGYGNNYWRGK